MLGVRAKEGTNSSNNEKGMDKPNIGGTKEKELTSFGDLLNLELVTWGS